MWLRCEQRQETGAERVRGAGTEHLAEQPEDLHLIYRGGKWNPGRPRVRNKDLTRSALGFERLSQAAVCRAG